MTSAASTIRPARALLSVSDKTGLIEFAAALHQLGIHMLSTGGTARLIAGAGLPVTEVADYTGFPEIMGGRIKTLHPKVHGALLGRRGVDEAVMTEHGIEAIDLLVVNLYPFAATIAGPGCTRAEAIEQIDIGGPAMLRAAAKNHDRVSVVVDPGDYAIVLQELQAGGISEGTRQRLAAVTFAHTARYDAGVAAYLAGQDGPFPETLSLSYVKKQALRYGENPHQQAAFYAGPAAGGIGAAIQLQGKPLSFNNIADADTALECVRRFDAPACVIVKHANPCGVAIGDDALTAYEGAYATDPTSAFGGVIACNRPLDGPTVHSILDRQFVEVLLAPGFDEAARSALAAKANVRALTFDEAAATPATLELKTVTGGLLAQTRDEAIIAAGDLKVVTRRAPSAAETDDLLFAWRVCKYVKSNAIVFARGGRTIGIGAGQMSRVISTRIAALKAAEQGLEVAGSVMASDAFLPFRDGLDAAAATGIRAVIQPGGSLRDAEVIAAADEQNIAMVFTSLRHFRH